MTSSKHSDWKIPADHYELKDKIGTGSYGYVCEAFDRRSHRNVAIKKINKVFEDLIDCKRILREIAILNRLDNPNVVKLLDIIVPVNLRSFDELYIVLELCDSDFKKLFRMEEYLSELHIKTLLYNLVVGIKYLHSAGIYHRDLKPANCLVNKDCSVKICDFGLSRAVGMESQPHLLNLPNTPREGGTQGTAHLKRQLTGHVVTRWYRAPELILLEEQYTESIDVWSVGCIFAELLGMLRENVALFADRGPLFPGSSCFPLSPDNKHASDYRFHTRGNRDQLNMIFNVLGTPDNADVETLEKADAKRYIRCFTPREGTGLAARFKGSGPEAIDLLKKMLVFNYRNRITINTILDHPYLAEVRRSASEAVAHDQVFLPFELEPELGQDQLRSYFLAEMTRFHPNAKLQ